MFSAYSSCSTFLCFAIFLVSSFRQSSAGCETHDDCKSGAKCLRGAFFKYCDCGAPGMIYSRNETCIRDPQWCDSSDECTAPVSVCCRHFPCDVGYQQNCFENRARCLGDTGCGTRGFVVDELRNSTKTGKHDINDV